MATTCLGTAWRLVAALLLCLAELLLPLLLGVPVWFLVLQRVLTAVDSNVSSNRELAC